MLYGFIYSIGTCCDFEEDKYIIIKKKGIKKSLKKEDKINLLLVDADALPTEKNINILSRLSNIVAIGGENNKFEIVSSKYTYPVAGDTITILNM